MTIFALGPFYGEEEEWKEVRAQLDKELANFTWLTPSAIEIFGGKFDPAKLRFPENIIASLPASPFHNMPAIDVRDLDGGPCLGEQPGRTASACFATLKKIKKRIRK